MDGKTWSDLGAGEFSNIANALSPQRIAFTTVSPCAYVRFSFIGLASAAHHMAIADLKLLRAG